MRERFRGTTVDALICLTVIALQAELWLTRRPDATVEVGVVTGGCVALLVGVLVARLLARRSRVAQALADAAAQADRSARAAESARLLRDRHEVVAEAVHSVIVEIVAAQQGVVRAAYPDDILTRLRSAEDGAHESIEELRQLAASVAHEAEPSHGAQNAAATDHGGTDHGPDHGGADHGGADHRALDHGAAGHGGADHGGADHGGADYDAANSEGVQPGGADHDAGSVRGDGSGAVPAQISPRSGMGVPRSDDAATV